MNTQNKTERALTSIATANVNGIRAACKNGMSAWVQENPQDIFAMQEVRATQEQARESIEQIFGSDIASSYSFYLYESDKKGRAGVAILSKYKPQNVRFGLANLLTNPTPDLDDTGRWLEADFVINGRELTVISAYIHSGEVDTPKQDAKWLFMHAVYDRLLTLCQNKYILLLGDLNIGHTTFDIKNWRGNMQKAGFLREERLWLNTLFGVPTHCKLQGVGGPEHAQTQAHNAPAAPEPILVDIGRQFHPNMDGPYTWWSWRGGAFDSDAGWRIDYHAATKDLSALARCYKVHRAPTYTQRWSDHSPVVAQYAI